MDNTNSVKQAINAAVQTKSAGALQAAAVKITSGAASSIKINQHMTLYNANKSGKADRAHACALRAFHCK